MKIYLIRHGESTSDIEDRYGGDYDDHLTSKGRKQAERLAVKLKNNDIEIIFSSPKLRAKETAEILKDNIKCNMKIFKDLRERNLYGILTGMKKKEAKEKYPDQVSLLKDFHNTVKGAESYNNFKERIINAFNKILESKYETIAIVTHGGPIKYIFREILKLGEIRDLRDCECIELEKRGNRPRLINYAEFIG